jgi:hypothetical protein
MDDLTTATAAPARRDPFRKIRTLEEWEFEFGCPTSADQLQAKKPHVPKKNERATDPDSPQNCDDFGLMEEGDDIDI